MRPRGFALPELLVAVSIACLTLTGLIWLDVDYIALARRIGDLGRPFVLGHRLQIAADDLARCGMPGAVLRLDGNKIVAIGPDRSEDIIVATREGAATILAAAGGGAVRFTRSVQLLAANADKADGAARPGWSAAAVEVGGATAAVFATRCDMPEICDYDSTTDRCRGDH